MTSNQSAATSVSSSQGPLGSDQMAFFDEQGYLVVDDVFTDADLQPVIDEVDTEVRARAEKLVAEGKLSRTYDELDVNHQLVAITEETEELMRDIGSGNLSGPAFFNLIRHPRLLSIAEQMCGHELIASSVYRLRPKVPGHSSGEVPWHQDAGYTNPYCDRGLMLTVWLPLVDATADHGCLWVIPGVHKQGIIEHSRRADKSYLVIPKKVRPDIDAVCAPVKKGGILLLTNMTPHASFTNKTDIVRWSMDLRYQNASLPTNAPITRLENESVSNEEEGVPPACYPPEADFLVRSRLRPDEVVTDAEDFHRIRREHINTGHVSRWSSVVDDE